MVPENYSAGLVSQSFWFHEFKTVVKLRQSGMELAEIKKKCVEENLFGADKEYRANRMAGYIVTRLKNMDDTLAEIFSESDLPTQKLINLFVIIKNDRLFFEFLYEVYREKVQLGADLIEASDVNVFFTKKEAQSEVIAGWNDGTKKHLRSNYLNFMTDANLLTEINRKKTITPPVLDVAFEQYLKTNNLDMFIKALTGVN